MRIQTTVLYYMRNGGVTRIGKTCEFETRPAQGQPIDVSDTCYFVVREVERDGSGEPISVTAIVDFETLQDLREFGWKESACHGH